MVLPAMPKVALGFFPLMAILGAGGSFGSLQFKAMMGWGFDQGAIWPSR